MPLAVRPLRAVGRPGGQDTSSLLRMRGAVGISWAQDLR